MFDAHRYPVEVEQDEDDRYVVTFPDFGWGATDGATRDEALAEARDLLRELITTTMREGRDLPAPSRAIGAQPLVTPPTPIALKAALYEAVRETGCSLRDVADDLGVPEREAGRLLSPDEATKVATMNDALRKLAASRQRTAQVLRKSPLRHTDMDLANALVVIPCSAAKQRGGSADDGGACIADWLPQKLALELLGARVANAGAVQLDESQQMPAVERYAGHLYKTAGGALQRIQQAGARLAIMTGGYGVVLADEPIGCYSQRLAERMWPDDLVARCLAAYAEAIEATTVVGLLAGSTPYAKVFCRVRWPESVQQAWLISPVARPAAGAQVAVPCAIGEALREVAESHSLPVNWTSKRGLPLRVVAMKREGGDQPTDDAA